jgi:pyridoxamine 5'-phosphate oxidase
MDMTTLDIDDPNPVPRLQRWLAHAEAASGQQDWHTMMLATADDTGRPSVRAVLLKSFHPASGAIVFYTNYHSRKARELEANPRVALAMYWERLDRQIRVEGRVERIPAETSDAYFASRPRDHQIGAWASDQSAPLEDWTVLLQRVLEAGQRFGTGPVPRPPHWGGYQVLPERVEFWLGGAGRIHQRVCHERDPAAAEGWRARWLNP